MRPAAVAVAAAWLAATAHVLGGGPRPDLLALAVAAVAVWAASAWLGRRRRGVGAYAVTLGSLGWALHTWFALTPSGCDAALRNGREAVHGGVHGGAATAGVHCSAGAGLGTDGAAAAASHVAHGGMSMVVAHVVAVVLTAALLALGEHGAAGLLAWLVPLASVPRPLVVPVATARPARAPRRLDACGLADVLPGGWSLRGPPRGAYRTASAVPA